MNKKHFIGVDISKDELDLSLLDQPDYENFSDLKVDNNIEGFSDIVYWLDARGIKLEDCAFCMEHTGNYGLLFFSWLSQQDILFCVEPALQIKRSVGLTRGKNDKVDAKRIANYLYIHKARLQAFEMPSVLLLKIKHCLTYRKQMVRIRTALKNSLKSHKQYQIINGFAQITNQLQQQIQQQDQYIEQAERQIIRLIKSDAQLSKNDQLATSVKGIGLIIGAFMLVSTNNFTSFDNGRKYASYVGIATFEFSSGSFIKGKTRVSNLANKTIRTLLVNGANSAVTWDQQIKKYYQRKTEQGKEHNVIINAVCCKLVNRVFAVVKRQSPFVEIYQHNFVA